MNVVFDRTARKVTPGWTATAFAILHDGGMNCTAARQLFSLYRILKKIRKSTSTKIFRQFVIIGDHTTQIIATKSPRGRDEVAAISDPSVLLQSELGR